MRSITHDSMFRLENTLIWAIWPIFSANQGETRYYGCSNETSVHVPLVYYHASTYIAITALY